ncbi:MAG: 50S ribosomal protein L22 [Oscillospiraceae bacterium]|jgi:large subunit ribosomal protein L22|nr:50S ribosomal protein L22 [Oscillospiraceae bacterium]
MATAKATYIRMSPRKVKIVLDLIRNQNAEKALAILKYTPRAACEPIAKVLNSAIANAVNNDGMDRDTLVVSECYVGQAATQKRMRPRAKGRGDRILKKSSHITVTVTEAA